MLINVQMGLHEIAFRLDLKTKYSHITFHFYYIKGKVTGHSCVFMCVSNTELLDTPKSTFFTRLIGYVTDSFVINPIGGG